MNNSQHLRTRKIVVVGGVDCAKTSFTLQFVSTFANDSGEYDPTIEDSYFKECQIDDEVVQLEILEAAGQEQYSAMREQHMRCGDGFILMYSVTCRFSFEEIKAFHQQILRVKDKDYIPMVIVGNNCDLEEDRQVSTQEGMALARSLGCRFIEASGKHQVNVDHSFFELVREIRVYERQPSPPTKKVKPMNSLRQSFKRSSANLNKALRAISLNKR